MTAKTANRRARTDRPHTVAVLTYDGLSMFEFAVACEAFDPRNNSDLGGEFYRLLVCGPAESVSTDNGLRLGVPRRLRSLELADTVIVPPCERIADIPAATLTALRRAHARGARIASLCTGAFVLAEAGLLDGRRVTTHWGECAELARRYPGVDVDPDVLFVDGGDVLTSAGSAASIDLCLHLVRDDYGAEIATRLARLLVVPPYREGGQAQYIETPLPRPSADDSFAATLDWMQRNLAGPVSVPELAGRAAMSPRTFARRFVASTGVTPYRWLLQQRIRLAQRLLEHGELSVEAVAVRSGFGDADNLRKQFRRHVRTTPQAYRATFAEREPA